MRPRRSGRFFRAGGRGARRDQPTAHAAADDEQPLDIVAWGCGSGFARETGPPDCRDQFTDAARATSTTSLRLWVTFPDCWDGDRLTSLGSNAHVRYSEAGACPDGFPVAIPQLQMAIDFPAVDPAGLSLASGGTETAHADFWNVWDQQTLEDEVRLCLNRDLVCGTAS